MYLLTQAHHTTCWFVCVVFKLPWVRSYTRTSEKHRSCLAWIRAGVLSKILPLSEDEPQCNIRLCTHVTAGTQFDCTWQTAVAPCWCPGSSSTKHCSRIEMKGHKYESVAKAHCYGIALNWIEYVIIRVRYFDQEGHSNSVLQLTKAFLVETSESSYYSNDQLLHAIQFGMNLVSEWLVRILQMTRVFLDVTIRQLWQLLLTLAITHLP